MTGFHYWYGKRRGAPAGQQTSEMIADMTRAAIDLRTQMATFDDATLRQLSGRTGLAEIASISSLTTRNDLGNILSEDPHLATSGNLHRKSRRL